MAEKCCKAPIFKVHIIVSVQSVDGNGRHCRKTLLFLFYGNSYRPKAMPPIAKYNKYSVPELSLGINTRSIGRESVRTFIPSPYMRLLKWLL